MAAEGGYAASGQFEEIARQAAAAVLSVQRLSTEFAALATIAAGIGGATAAFGQLQQTLVLTNSVAQGNAEQLKQMDAAVRDLALGFRYSANEGGKALYNLASAGFSVGESLRALSGVVLLAQGTLSDLSVVADTVANVITAFNLEANDTTRVANLFAAAISVTQATMDKLAYSMRYVAPVAASMGASIEQTTVALSALYNAGNRGQQGGTLLRDILVRLINPSKEASQVLSQLGIQILDADGKTRNFVEILKDLQKANASPITLSKIFEQRGLSGAQTLLQAFDPNVFAKKLADADFAKQVQNVADKARKPLTEIKTLWDYLTVAETNTNFATKLAIEQNNTMAGSFFRAKNAVTELGITFGETLAPGLTAFANSITEAVRSFRSLDEGTKKFYTTLPLIAIALVGITKGLQGIFTAGAGAIATLANLSTNLGNVAAGFRAASTAQSTFVNAQTGAVLPGNAALWRNNPNVISQAQFQNRNAPPGTAPIPTSTSGNLATGAAGAGAIIGGALAAVSTIATVVVGLVSIGAVAYAAWPFIKELFNHERGTSLIGVTPKTAPEEIQSILSTPGRPTEKLENLEGRAKKRSDDYLFFEDVAADNVKTSEKAKAELKELVIALLEKKGFIREAKEIKRGNDELLQTLIKGDVGRPSERALLSSEEFIEKRKQYEDARKSIKDAETSIDNANADLLSIGQAMYRLVTSKAFVEDAAAKKVSGDIKKLIEENQVTIIIDNYLIGLEKQAREISVAASKARGALNNNPIDDFVTDLVTGQLDTLNKLQSAGDNIRTEFEKHLGTTVVTNAAIQHSIRDILAGSDYTKLILDAEGKVNAEATPEKYKGVNTLFREGKSIEEIRKALARDEAFIRDNAPKNDETVKAQLNRILAVRRKQTEDLLDLYQSTGAKSFFDLLDKQRQNRDFSTKLRDTFVTLENEFLTSIFEASGGTAYGVKLRIDINALNKRYDDQLKVIEDDRLSIIKRAGGQDRNITPEKFAQIKQTGDAFADKAKEFLNKSYVQQAANIRNAIINGQLKLLGDLRVANAQADATKAQINEELVLLYTQAELAVPSNIFTSAVDAPAKQATANAIKALEEAKDVLRQLGAKKAAIDYAIAETARTGKEVAPQLPLEAVGGPPEQMAEAIKRSTTDFEARFGVKLTTFTDNFEEVLNRFLKAFGGQNDGKPPVQVPAQSFDERYPKYNVTAAGTSIPSNIVVPSNTASRSSSLDPIGAPKNLDNATIAALDNAASKVKANTDALSMMVQLESKWDVNAVNSQGRRGLTQMRSDTLGFDPNAHDAPSQLDAYGDYLEKYRIPQKLASAGVDMSELSTSVQAAILQGFQFAPNAGKGKGYDEPPQWLKDFAAGKIDTPTTKTPQAKELGDTSIEQMVAYYDKANEQGKRFAETQKEVSTLNKDIVTAQKQTSAELGVQITKGAERVKQAEQVVEATKKVGDTPIQSRINQYELEGKAIAELGKQAQVSENAFTGLSYAVQKSQHEMGNTAKLVADTYNAAATSIASNLTSLITGQQKDWKKALQNIANDIATTILKALILRAITGVVGGSFGIPTGVSGNILGKAAGGAYMQGNESPVQAFADGAAFGANIYNSPTLFNYMKGGKSQRGMMGESGPEAIIPLSRGPDGKLGIRSIGTPLVPIGSSDRGTSQGNASYSSNFHFYGGGQDSPTPSSPNRSERNRMASMQKELDREMEATFLRVAGKHMRNGGMLNPSAQRLGIAGAQ